MISVIVPAYNSETFLDECADSILSQKGLGCPLELIIIDDGSTDGTSAIADAIAARDNRVRVLHTDNQGLSQARNEGMDVARGQFICFVDADDLLLGGALAAMAKAIGDADVLVAGFVAGTDSRSLPAVTALSPIRLDSEQSMLRMLYQENFSSAPWGRLFRADALDRLRFVPGLYYEDLEFNFRFLSTERSVAYATQPVCFYRQHPDSILHYWSERRTHVLDITDNIVRELAASGPSLSRAARDRRFSAHYNIFIEASRAGKSGVADRCWQVIKSTRKAELLDSRVRLKNKLGAMLSYLGRNIAAAIGKHLG